MAQPSPSLRSQAARIAGLTLHLRGDSNAIAARARAGFERRFEREIAALFPGLSPGSETFRSKVELTRRLFFARLARASVTARAATARHRKRLQAEQQDRPAGGESRG